jgi:hypothetical protein
MFLWTLKCVGTLLDAGLFRCNCGSLEGWFAVWFEVHRSSIGMWVCSLIYRDWLLSVRYGSRFLLDRSCGACWVDYMETSMNWSCCSGGSVCVCGASYNICVLLQTSFSVANALYYLAKNPDKQQKLFEEIQQYVPDKDQPVTSNILNELRYLKACIKESMRYHQNTAECCSLVTDQASSQRN